MMRVIILLLTLHVLGVSSVMSLKKKIDGPWQTIYLAASTMEKINEGSPLRTYFRHILCGRRCNQVYLYFFIKKGTKCQLYKVIGRKKQEVYYAQSKGKQLNKEEMTEFMNLVEEMGIEEENVQRIMDTDNCPSKIKP
uniref:Probasin n=1 Tax=Mus musculus TaxID=10090 RepID=B1AVU3_MOUSE